MAMEKGHRFGLLFFIQNQRKAPLSISSPEPCFFRSVHDIDGHMFDPASLFG
jgi:hypothetical protein